MTYIKLNLVFSKHYLFSPSKILLSLSTMWHYPDKIKGPRTHVFFSLVSMFPCFNAKWVYYHEVEYINGKRTSAVSYSMKTLTLLQ